MAVAQVIPLRRLPRQRPWLDYDIPQHLNLQVGHLVTISLREKQQLGVVWNIVPSSDVESRLPILDLASPSPLITPWQRQIVTALEPQVLGDVASLLQHALPDWPKRKRTDDGIPLEKVIDSPSWTGDVQTWWYRQRSHIVDRILGWVRFDKHRPSLIISPTHEDVDRVADACRSDGQDILVVDSRLTPAQYRQAYVRVLSGQAPLVIGTDQAALLPFPQPPRVLFDQEEHAAHRPQGWPKWDVLNVLTTMTDVVVTSPAPSLQWVHRYQLPAPDPDHRRILVSLDQPKSSPWLTPDVITLLEQATSDHRVAIIVPRHGYAGAITCEQCGLAVDCPVCHHRASLHGQPPAPVVCAACGQTSALPATCPRCSGANWKFGLIGQDRVIELIQRLGFSAGPISGDCSSVVGTYQAYRELSADRLAAVVLLHGDALLNWPDFSAEERAWHYLARLQAAVDTPVVVQTYSPDLPFWQRWRSGDDQAWYQHEWTNRERLRLPPTVDHWLVELTEPANATAARDMQQRLQAEFGSTLTLQSLPPKRTAGGTIHRFTITAPLGTLATMTKWANLFPTPWRIDTQVTSWL